MVPRRWILRLTWSFDFTSSIFSVSCTLIDEKIIITSARLSVTTLNKHSSVSFQHIPLTSVLSLVSQQVRETETWMPMKTTQMAALSMHSEQPESSGESPIVSDFGFTDDDDDEADPYTDYSETLYDDEDEYDELSGSGDGGWCHKHLIPFWFQFQFMCWRCSSWNKIKCGICFFSQQQLCHQEESSDHQLM